MYFCGLVNCGPTGIMAGSAGRNVTMGSSHTAPQWEAEEKWLQAQTLGSNPGPTGGWKQANFIQSRAFSWHHPVHRGLHLPPWAQVSCHSQPTQQQVQTCISHFHHQHHFSTSSCSCENSLAPAVTKPLTAVGHGTPSSSSAFKVLV